MNRLIVTKRLSSARDINNPTWDQTELQKSSFIYNPAGLRAWQHINMSSSLIGEGLRVDTCNHNYKGRYFAKKNKMFEEDNNSDCNMFCFVWGTPFIHTYIQTYMHIYIHACIQPHKPSNNNYLYLLMHLIVDIPITKCNFN